jgi:hypothetical protein
MARCVVTTSKRSTGHGPAPQGAPTGLSWSLIEREQPAVEEFADLDAAAQVGAPTGARRNLYPARAQADGVVVGDDARVATAEDAIEIARRPPLAGGRVVWRAGKAPVEVAMKVGRD